jgi:hypothetical protein
LLFSGTLTEEASSEPSSSESADVVGGAAVLTDDDAEVTRVEVATRLVTVAALTRPTDDEEELDEAGALELLEDQTLLELLHVLLLLEEEDEGACQVLVELVVGATHTEDEVVGATQVDCKSGQSGVSETHNASA